MSNPVSLSLDGAFWDVQLYQGLLYLFKRDSTLMVLDWDALIASWEIDPHLAIALESSFRENSLLYKVLGDPRAANDPDLTYLLASKLSALSGLDLTISEEQMRRFTLGTFDSPFAFPHADSEVHYGWLAVGSDDGIEAAHLRRRKAVGKRVWLDSGAARYWDGPVYGLSAAFRSFAIASGTDGVAVLDLPTDDTDRPLSEPVLAGDGTFYIGCSWLYASVFCTARRGSGMVIQYSWATEQERDPPRRHRHLVGVLQGERLVGARELTWAARDKLYAISEGGVTALRFRPTEELGGKVTAIDRQELPHGLVVQDAASAIFGTVLEVDDGLRILATDGSIHELGGPVVRWRMYPRSTYYDNQLHVILDDRLLVLSFSHDYFVDQRTKAWGSRLDARRLL